LKRRNNKMHFRSRKNFTGKAQRYPYVENNRIGDHICYYNDAATVMLRRLVLTKEATKRSSATFVSAVFWERDIIESTRHGLDLKAKSCSVNS